MDNKIIGVVSNIKIVSSDKRNQISGGCVIEFETTDNIKKDSYISIKSSLRTHYFKVIGFKTLENNNLSIEASEIGYWANKIDRLMEITDLDIRHLKGINIVLIDDEQIIKKIHEMSCWC